MKRILFTLLMLWSISYGQSPIYIRGDSVFIQKNGGNSTLIIQNATRNVVGGVLTNTGGGRTQFIMPGDSTSNRITRIYRKPGTDSVFYCIYNTCTFAYKDSTGGSGGLSGGNLGSSYRIYSPGSQGVKTMAAPASVKIDSATSNTLTIQLDGDNSSPGNDYVYGTNGIGTKGFLKSAVLDTVPRSDSSFPYWDSTQRVYSHMSKAQLLSGAGVGTVTGSGSANRVAHWSSSSALTSTAGFDFDGVSLKIPSSTTAAILQAGNATIGSLGTNNLFFGSNIYYSSGFKSLVSGYTPMIYFPNGDINMYSSSATSGAGSAATQNMRLKILGSNGNIAIGPNVSSVTPLGYLHLSNGTTSMPPFVFTQASSGLTTSPVAGAVEVLVDSIYYTINTGTARKRFVLSDAALTSGTVPVATSGGRLIDGLIISKGTWTPTITNGSNIASTANPTGKYVRVGDEVTFTVYVQVTPTASSTTCVFDFSLPAGGTSDFTVQMDAICTGSSTYAGLSEIAQGFANTTDDRITVATSLVSSTNARDVIISGHYIIK